MSDGVYSERKNVVANDTQSAKKKKPKLKPSAAGSIWKGGARERADDVFFCHRHKKASEQSELCSDVVARKEGFEPSPGFRPATPLAGEPLRPLGYFRKFKARI